MSSEYARNILCADNYELFDIVCRRLNARPIEPIESIAYDVGVTVDELCRWVIGFKEERRRVKSPYQGKARAPLAQSQSTSTPLWSDTDDGRRARIAQKARDGARAARLAMMEGKTIA